MKLRYQLFFISLCLLILPWGAWQYLKAVDAALRESQTQSLLETANLISDRLALEPQLFDDFFVTSPSNTISNTGEGDSSHSWYAFPLNAAPIVDGYDDEWRSVKTQQLPPTSDVQLRIGANGEMFYFYFNVKDSFLQYYNPLADKADGAINEDHIVLQTLDGKGQSRDYLIRTSAPSGILAHYYNDVGRLRRQDAIKGVWSETTDGYSVELAVEKSLLKQGFSISVADKQKNTARKIILSHKPVYVTTPSQEIQQFIQTFRSPSLSLKVLNPDQWSVASITAVESADTQKKTPWLIEWLYRQLLNSENLLVRNSAEYQSYEQYPEVAQSLQEGSGLQWYWRSGDRLQRQTLVSVATPIYHQLSAHNLSGNQFSSNQFSSNQSKRLLGYVIIEKTTNQLIALTTSAFSQLFIYTVGTFILVAMILLFYASWLSFRISRLNQVANQLVNEKGTINNENLEEKSWPDLKKRDELGDLSRGYRDLLLQVQEYNHYLRTLSSKLSHELRTPIAVVKSSLENILQVDDQAAQREYNLRAQQGVQRLNSILTAMSSASSVEQSVADAEFQVTHLNMLLEELSKAYQNAYPEHVIQFEPECDNAYALLAQELFVQMLDKLVDNATDFSPIDSAIVIRLRADKKNIVVDVENSGELLPESMQDKLFESMVSLRETNKSDSAHLGLGLYIVRLIVDCHQGQVMAKNKLDESGVIFSITLPAAS